MPTNQIITYCGRNNLLSNVESKDLADSITKLAKNTKFDVTKDEVSGILLRRDPFNTKAEKAFKCYKKLAKKRSLSSLSTSLIHGFISVAIDFI